ncbi:hypothetical protein AB8880_03895 [Alphaproteobacteria bacterium LSUCC0684]
MGRSFLNWPVCTNWQDLKVDAILFGVPHGKPYAAVDEITCLLGID